MNLTLDSKITHFFIDHHVLTLATSVDNQPYCANCFYAYDIKSNALIFTSDEETKHVQDALSNSSVAGSVVLETSVVGKIQGIQFNGQIHKNESKQIEKIYMKRFPFAKLMTTTLWVIDLDFIKMTDNRLGFGKKLIWNKT